MPYTAHVLHGFNPLEALETEWRDLFNQAESPNPFFSAEWMFTWLNHRGGRVFPVTLIVRDDDERLVAAWPFFEYPAIGGRGLWVGLSDIADCLEPLVIRPDESLLKTVFEALGQLLGEYRFIWIPLLSECLVRDHLEPALQAFPNLTGIHKRAPNYFVDLTAQGGFDDYLADTVGSKTEPGLPPPVTPTRAARPGRVRHLPHAGGVAAVRCRDAFNRESELERPGANRPPHQGRLRRFF